MKFINHKIDIHNLTEKLEQSLTDSLNRHKVFNNIYQNYPEYFLTNCQYLIQHFRYLNVRKG